MKIYCNEFANQKHLLRLISLTKTQKDEKKSAGIITIKAQLYFYMWCIHISENSWPEWNAINHFMVNLKYVFLILYGMQIKESQPQRFHLDGITFKRFFGKIPSVFFKSNMTVCYDNSLYVQKRVEKNFNIIHL